MKLHTFVMLTGCVLAVTVVAATDHYHHTYSLSRDTGWVCRTDMECEEEEMAKRNDQRCLIISDEMICLPIDRR